MKANTFESFWRFFSPSRSPFFGRFCVILAIVGASFLCRFGDILGTLWNVFGLSWVHFWAFLGSFWCHFGARFDCFAVMCHFTVIFLVIFAVVLGSILNFGFVTPLFSWNILSSFRFRSYCPTWLHTNSAFWCPARQTLEFGVMSYNPKDSEGKKPVNDHPFIAFKIQIPTWNIFQHPTRRTEWMKMKGKK